MTAQTGIFIDGDPPVKESGEISISGTSIVFTNDKRELTMSAGLVELTLGGTANRVVYIKDPSDPKITLHTADHSIFRDPAFASNPALRRVLRQKRGHHTALWVTLGAIVAVVFTAIWFVFIDRDLLVNAIVSQIPPEVERSIGDKLYELQFKDNPDIVTDRAVNREMRALVEPLVRAAENPDYEFKIHIMRDPTMNAFAMPGGHIVILTGLIEKTERPEELLGVLGHEMAHVTLRHSLKQFVHTVSGWVLVSLLGAGTDQMVYVLGDKARGMFELGYSRDHELEADEVGLKYLNDAGIPATGLVRFFERLKDAEPELPGGEVFELLSTHPATDGRIEALRDRIAATSANVNANLFDYEGFKELVKRADTSAAQEE